MHLDHLGLPSSTFLGSNDSFLACLFGRRLNITGYQCVVDPRKVLLTIVLYEVVVVECKVPQRAAQGRAIGHYYLMHTFNPRQYP